MEEILMVDRIENGYAVCETEQGEKRIYRFLKQKTFTRVMCLSLKTAFISRIRTKQKQEEKDTRSTGRPVGLIIC